MINIDTIQRSEKNVSIGEVKCVPVSIHFMLCKKPPTPLGTPLRMLVYRMFLSDLFRVSQCTPDPPIFFLDITTSPIFLLPIIIPIIQRGSERRQNIGSPRIRTLLRGREVMGHNAVLGDQRIPLGSYKNSSFDG